MAVTVRSYRIDYTYNQMIQLFQRVDLASQERKDEYYDNGNSNKNSSGGIKFHKWLHRDRYIILQFKKFRKNKPSINETCEEIPEPIYELSTLVIFDEGDHSMALLEYNHLGAQIKQIESYLNFVLDTTEVVFNTITSRDVELVLSTSTEITNIVINTEGINYNALESEIAQNFFRGVTECIETVGTENIELKLTNKMFTNKKDQDSKKNLIKMLLDISEHYNIIHTLRVECKYIENGRKIKRKKDLLKENDRIEKLDIDFTTHGSEQIIEGIKELYKRM